MTRRRRRACARPSGEREPGRGRGGRLSGRRGAARTRSINRGSEPARMLIVSEMNAPRHRRAARSRARSAPSAGRPAPPARAFDDVYFRRDAVDFWDGEEPPPAPLVSVTAVGVAGAGTMGAGIAQLACLGGYRDAASTTRSRRRSTRASSGCAPTSAAAPSGSAGAPRRPRRRPRGSATAAELDDLAGCDLVIEAAPEDLELKRELFAALEAVCGPDAVLATNTSSLLGDRDRRRGRAARADLRHALLQPAGADEAGRGRRRRAHRPRRRWRRRPRSPSGWAAPRSAAPTPGFIVNRCNRPFTLESLRMLDEGIAGHAEIDRIAARGRRLPDGAVRAHGPDRDRRQPRGRAVVLRQRPEPRWQPHPIQERMVADGPARPQDRARLLRLRGRQAGRAAGRRPRSTPELRRDGRSSGSSPSSSTRPASPPTRASRRRTTSTPRCGSASTTRAGRSSGSSELGAGARAGDPRRAPRRARRGALPPGAAAARRARARSTDRVLGGRHARVRPPPSATKPPSAASQEPARISASPAIVATRDRLVEQQRRRRRPRSRARGR